MKTSKYFYKFFFLIIFFLIIFSPGYVFARVFTFETPNYICQEAGLNIYPTYITPNETIGEGKTCTGKLMTCVQQPEGDRFFSGSFSEKYGQRAPSLLKSTGNTVFCNSDGIPTPVRCEGDEYILNNQIVTASGSPTPVVSGTPIPTTSETPIPTPTVRPSLPGNYCLNQKIDLSSSEVDNKCNLVRDRDDIGFEQIVTQMGYGVVNITEKNIDAWINNDSFDIDGNLAQIRNLMGETQILYKEKKGLYEDYVDIGKSERTKNYISQENIDQLLRIDREYLSQGDIVPMDFAFNDNGHIKAHAVILYQVKELTIDTKMYRLDFVDPNTDREEYVSIICFSTDDYNYECNSNIYKNIASWQFDESLVSSLRQSLDAYCDAGSQPGDICARRNNIQGWVKANALKFLPNTKIPKSKGICLGWSQTLTRLAYLANFVGEGKDSPFYPSCASWVGGENKTAQCGDNKSACKISFKVFYGENREIVEPVSSQCAYKNTETSLVKGNMLSEQYGVKNINCDGVERSPFQFNIFSPIKFSYIAEPFTTPSTSLIPTNSVSTKFTSFIDSLRTNLKSTYSKALAWVIAPIKPSCMANFNDNNFPVSYTYQQGYIFSHPTRPFPKAFFPADATVMMSNLYDLWNYDAVFTPDSDFAWVYKYPNEDPIVVPIDQYSAQNIFYLKERLAKLGVDNTCRQTSVFPPRFVKFLTDFSVSVSVPPITPTTPVVPTTKTDLTSSFGIFSLSGIYQAGNTVNFFANVANRGTDPAGTFTVKWYVDGLEKKSTYIYHISALSTVYSTATQFSWLATAGKHTITFKVDANNNIAETNEQNNVAMTTISIGLSTIPIPTPTPSVSATTCTDSDGGKDPYTKGYTVGYDTNGTKSTIYDQIRINPYGDGYNYVVEWFCTTPFANGSVYRTNTNIRCLYGYANGRCLRFSPSSNQTPITTYTPRPTVSVAPTRTPTPTVSSTPTPVATYTPTPKPTVSATPSQTPTVTVSPEPSPSPVSVSEQVQTASVFSPLSWFWGLFGK